MRSTPTCSPVHVKKNWSYLIIGFFCNTNTRKTIQQQNKNYTTVPVIRTINKRHRKMEQQEKCRIFSSLKFSGKNSVGGKGTGVRERFRPYEEKRAHTTRGTVGPTGPAHGSSANGCSTAAGTETKLVSPYHSLPPIHRGSAPPGFISAPSGTTPPPPPRRPVPHFQPHSLQRRCAMHGAPPRLYS